MLYVSILVELLRTRPALAVGMVATMQAALWTFIPAVFYAGPPGDVPMALAIGHEFQLGTHLGPPLAFWLAELAFRLAGGSVIGVYVLSQICVVATYGAAFALGSRIVGQQHAALAVLLLVGISVMTVPTPEFGPVVLSMPLWAIVLLHYWQAAGEGRRIYWAALAVEAGLLLLTTYASLLLVGLLVVFTLGNRRARSALGSIDPWLAGVVAFIVMFPHLVWLAESGSGLIPMLSRLRMQEAVVDNFIAWLRQMVLIVAAHAGLVVLVAIVIGWPWTRREPAPALLRKPLDPFARQFVYFFAVMPALAATFFAVLIGWTAPVGGIAPLVVLSGLAVVVAAGDRIQINRQHAVIAAWFGLLLIPPIMVVAALAALPWLAIDLTVNLPAAQIAHFYSDSFQRRVGAPLPVVTGEARTAAVVAFGSPSRPSLLLAAAPEQSPWITIDDVRKRGAIIVWPANDSSGSPPAYVLERFPGIVPEVPRAFARPIQGRLPLLRIGWAMIRPETDDNARPTDGGSQR